MTAWYQSAWAHRALVKVGNRCGVDVGQSIPGPLGEDDCGPPVGLVFTSPLAQCHEHGAGGNDDSRVPARAIRGSQGPRVRRASSARSGSGRDERAPALLAAAGTRISCRVVPVDLQRVVEEQFFACRDALRRADDDRELIRRAVLLDRFHVGFARVVQVSGRVAALRAVDHGTVRRRHLRVDRTDGRE